MDTLWDSMSDYFESSVIVPSNIPEKLIVPFDQLLSTEIPPKDRNEFEYRGIESLPEDVITQEETAEMEQCMLDSAGVIENVLETLVAPEIEKIEKQIKANKSNLRKLHTAVMDKVIKEATAKAEAEVAAKKKRPRPN